MDTAAQIEGTAQLDRRDRFVARGVSNQNPVVMVRAEGARMWDESGNEYIDFAGGIGVMNVGHSHPEVVAAVKEQADKLFHTCVHVALNEPYLALAEALCRIAPISGAKKALLLNSGAEAVENAVKIARSCTGRSAVIAFEGGFHGRTMLGMSLTSKVDPYKLGFGPFVPEVYRMPYPNPYRHPFGAGDLTEQAISFLRHAFETYVDPNQVAAVIVEPVQGEGGFIVPPANFLPRLQELCREHGILLIVDEVQTGFGRTGRMFATAYAPDVDPDMVVMAKSMGGGLPISAVVGKADVMDAPKPGGLGGTYGGNPLACVAALKVIEIMERDGLPERACEIGRKSMAFLRELQARHPMIGDVRGLGAMVAIELVKDRATKQPYPEAVAKISQRCLSHGLVTVKAGVYNNVIRLLSPLVISDDELQRGLDILAQAIRETEAEL
ncbi:4-aminobutyrate--2-oxoglutarate transaminase [Alicyclobacillus mali]|uniref:(S)-3-amino-2-methylpropionate transaminase n=1 Tax=Alicyclobacillus mali (ex Roth et al. 2021) TaxID=1123961 RepID=A0ABS0F4D3_9BACL|nr:4-aminobutyrate--2-oxoglutarate transaminase [Alicyclobacillus mali (ex Roth et al. 2021)]MBF8378162.1 4-aminobutyrate--2-oxoglutarate transaminase [Alicyclobacillus mali (ex Roth et al. 2021)]